MMKRDPAALFFGVAALLTLGVSIPATFALLRPFHDAGGYAGWGLTFFAMLVFEVGAVGAKLITIAIPQWRGRLTLLTLALLVLTSVGNYLHGAELWRAAELPPTLASLRGAWLEPWLVAGAAALFPALLFVWLLAFAARVEQLHTPALAPPHHAHQETTVNVLVTDSAALSKTARVKQIAQARGVSESTVWREVKRKPEVLEGVE